MADNNSRGEKTAKLYNIFEFACVAALAALCLMLFGFFGASVYKEDLGDLGGDLGFVAALNSNESAFCDLGGELEEPVLNVYTSTSKDNDLLGISGICSAMVAIACFALAFAVVAFLVYRRSCAVPDRIGKLNRMFIVNCGAAVVHLVFLILGAAMISKIKDEGAGLMVAGAAPILITVFSAVFLGVTVAALVGCYLIASKNADEITFRKLARAGVPVDRNKDIPVQLEYAKENYALNKLVNGKQRRLRSIDKTEKSEMDKLAAMEREHATMPRVGNVNLDDNAKWQYIDKFKRAHRRLAVSIMCFPIILGLLLYALLIPLFVYKGNPWKCSAGKLKSHKGWFIAAVVLAVAFMIGISALLFTFRQVIVMGGAIPVVLALFAPMLIVALVALRRANNLTVELYGTAKPQKGAVPCVDVGDLSDFYVAQERARSAQKAVDARKLTDDMFDSRIADQQAKLLAVAAR